MHTQQFYNKNAAGELNSNDCSVKGRILFIWQPSKYDNAIDMV